MRWSAPRVAASLILLAANVLTLEDIDVTVEQGADFITAIDTKGHDVTHCYLITPNGDTIEFNPTDDDNTDTNDKYELNVSADTGCSVIIKHLDENDNGVWELNYDAEDDQIFKQLYRITVSSDIRSGTRLVQYLPVERYDTNLGAIHSVLINVALFTTNEACFLETPVGERHTLTTTTQIPGIDFIVGDGVECGVRFTVTKDMIGEWTLVGWANHIFQPIETRLPFTITVEELEVVPDDVNRTLVQFDHVTRAGASIDLTLSKTDDDEECYLTTPEGKTEALAKIEISGVTIHASSNFVNCRVTIGPMEQKLLGIWSLCGRRIDNIERCQSANVTWHSNTDPYREWEVNTLSAFDYNVHFGGIISPSVFGSGALLTCQVVTPDGEDLVLTTDTDYPGLERAQSDCRVDIGPIDEFMLGNWLLYAKYHSPFFGLSETRLPFTFNLYNEDDPYSQAYNVTTLDPVNRIVNIGNTIIAEVTGSGSVDSCYYTTPRGVIHSSSDSESKQGVTFVNVSSGVVCRISIGPITETMIGQWQVIGKFSARGVFTERRQAINIIREDPVNPIMDENRRVDFLTPQTLNTELGARHTVTIPLHSFTTVESCHIRTPQGLQYKLMEGFNVPGVTIEAGNHVACGVSLTVRNKDMVGEWILISRAIIISQSVEQRLNVTVRVEETVDAFPSEISIMQGNDLYMRLREPTDLASTCSLVGPIDHVAFEIDTMHENACGFMVRNIDSSASGQWIIVYGNTITYKAYVNVTVIENQVVDMEDLILYKHNRVNQTLGPDNLVYCRLQDPKGITVSEGFGQCNLVIDRVSMEHEGEWTIAVGLRGQIVVDSHKFRIFVIDGDDKPVVTTNVEEQKPEVIISCSLSSPIPVRTCKFRDPNGEILIAAQGVGEYRYAFYGTEVGLESEITTNQCGLRITNPTVSDLGLWRCAMETDSETYFGFLRVLCPWALQRPEVQAVVTTEPVLEADRKFITAAEGDSTTVTCSIQTAIRYCFFRSRNGTTFSVSPATSTPTMEYVGAGFEAGECGVRLRRVAEADTGLWSCHVGLANNTEPEQRADFNITVQPQMVVVHHFKYSRDLMVENHILMPGTLKYCRFVRMDGVGFTQNNVPEGYTFIGDIGEKYCAIKMAEPTILNLHPWVVAAKLVGMETEIVKTTTENLLTPAPGEQGDDSKQVLPMLLWTIIALLSVLIFLLFVTFIPKINKKWIKEEINKYRKKPPQYYSA